jgi:soluble lytic murein transglycosylase-like protein
MQSPLLVPVSLRAEAALSRRPARVLSRAARSFLRVAAASLLLCCCCLPLLSAFVAEAAVSGRLEIGDAPIGKARLWSSSSNSARTISAGQLEAKPVEAKPVEAKPVEAKPALARANASGTMQFKLVAHAPAPPRAVALFRAGPAPAPAFVSGAAKGAAPRSSAVADPSRSIPPEWRRRLSETGLRHGLDAALLAAVVRVESNFNALAVSPKGALGAMQLMPDTGKYLGLKDFFDPDANVEAGAQYLAGLLQEFPRLENALAAYNAGPESVRRHGGPPPYAETRRYVALVLEYYTRYRAGF